VIYTGFWLKTNLPNSSLASFMMRTIEVHYCRPWRGQYTYFHHMLVLGHRYSGREDKPPVPKLFHYTSNKLNRNASYYSHFCLGQEYSTSLRSGSTGQAKARGRQRLASDDPGVYLTAEHWEMWQRLPGREGRTNSETGGEQVMTQPFPFKRASSKRGMHYGADGPPVGSLQGQWSKVVREEKT
jgi:hypothetical protein